MTDSETELEREIENTPAVPDVVTPPSRLTKFRNGLGFWLLGLANNYPYVIMLSAAFDIIHGLEGGDSTNGTNSSDIYPNSCTLVSNGSTNTSSYQPRSHCQIQGTSVILLVDILPTLIIKLVAPYWMGFLPYWIRVLSVVGFSMASFLIVGFSSVESVVLFGVACASISSGFGEITFLSLTARYNKFTVTGWSSGTGAAGVVGALVYAGLATFLSPRVTLLIQAVMPVFMLGSYLFILGPSHSSVPADADQVATDVDPLIQTTEQSPHNQEKTFDSLKKRVKFFNRDESKVWWSHVRYIPHLFKYMLPLFLVYFAEYAINQGFFELLYNANTHLGAYCLDQRTQYRWLQVIYQVGVLLSRSSVAVVYIRHYWIFSLLQLINFVFFFLASIYLFLPSFWLTLFLVLYEGLLGGAVYVNAFYTIAKDVPEVHREFSMGVASVADSLGICVAGVAAIFIHSYICAHFIGFIST